MSGCCSPKKGGPGLQGRVVCGGLVCRNVVVKDLNHDGHPDLFVVNTQSNSVTCYFWNPESEDDEDAALFINRRDIAVGSSPRDLTSADFNGDGLDDFAVASVPEQQRRRVSRNRGAYRRQFWRGTLHCWQRRESARVSSGRLRRGWPAGYPHRQSGKRRRAALAQPAALPAATIA